MNTGRWRYRSRPVAGVLAAGLVLVAVSWVVRAAGLDDDLPARWVLDAGGTPARIAAWVTDAGGPEAMWLVAGVVGGVLAWRRRSITPPAVLVVTQLGSIQLVRAAKRLADEPRPPVELWLVEAGGRGFPSGHALHAAAMVTSAILVAVGHRHPRDAGRAADDDRSARRGRPIRARALAVVAVVGVVAVAGSRVLLGVHYPSDVTGGIGAGMVWGALVVALADARPRPRSRSPGV